MSARNEFIANLMLEAADLLKESAGANGAARRFYEESIKEQQNKINKAQRRAEQYERAGYGDKGHGDHVDFLKDVKGYLETNRDFYDTRNRDKKSRHSIANSSKKGEAYDNIEFIRNKSNNPTKHPRSYTRTYGTEYSSAYHTGTNNKGLSDKQKELHDRINKRAALKEAIDLFYEQAVLCEDAEEAEGYIQKAEELQKEFEDVPEERPVEMDDYNTSVNGGDDEDPDLDEIEDLCDGDKEVMALLTDDEDKSVTVDANNESIFGW